MNIFRKSKKRFSRFWWHFRYLGPILDDLDIAEEEMHGKFNEPPLFGGPNYQEDMVRWLKDVQAPYLRAEKQAFQSITYAGFALAVLGLILSALSLLS